MNRIDKNNTIIDNIESALKSKNGLEKWHEFMDSTEPELYKWLSEQVGSFVSDFSCKHNFTVPLAKELSYNIMIIGMIGYMLKHEESGIWLNNLITNTKKVKKVKPINRRENGK